MGRVTDFVETLTAEERERFADLIDECRAREAAIAVSVAKAEAALQRHEAQQREFWRGVEELKALSSHLKDSIGRLYLSSVPAKGRVS
jgi:predicted ATPase